MKDMKTRHAGWKEGMYRNKIFKVTYDGCADDLYYVCNQ